MSEFVKTGGHVPRLEMGALGDLVQAALPGVAVEVGYLEMTDPPAVTRREALYDASVDEVLDELRQVDDATHAVMVVGHNPTAHALAMEMIAHEDKSGRRQVERRGFPTCALAVYRLSLAHWSDIAEGTATVVGLFTPPY